MRTRWLLVTVALVAGLIWFPWPKSGVEGPVPRDAVRPTEESGGGPTLAAASKRQFQIPPLTPPKAGSEAPADRPGVELRVLTPEGEPVPRFKARLLSARGYRDLGTPSQGTLLIRPETPGSAPLPPGSVLEVWDARDGEDHGLPFAPQRVGPMLGSERTLEVRLEEGPVLSGVLLTPEGPLSTSVDVRLHPLDRWWESLFDRDLIDAGLAVDPTRPPPRLPYEGVGVTARSDSSGRFRVAFLRPGIVHELEIKVPDEFCRFERRKVSVGDGPLEIRLVRPVIARVTVLGPDQRPAQGIHVIALPPGGNGFEYESDNTTGADGVALLGSQDDSHPGSGGGLDPTRKYKLVANPNYEAGIIRDRRPWMLGKDVPPPGFPDLAEKAWDDWTPADTTIHLERGFTVSGTVLDSAGRALGGRFVGLCTPVGFGCYETAANGRFVYRGVPAGTIYLGLDHGGGIGGIVDDLRETMWDASFGEHREYSPEKPPPIRAWTRLEVSGDLEDVTLRLPATVSAIVFPPAAAPEVEPAPDQGAFSPIHFDATTVVVLRRTEAGWKHFRGLHEESGGSLVGSGRGLQLDGLVPGHTYAAWMQPVAGAYAYLQFPAEVGTVTLERTVGGEVRGEILNRPPDSSRIRINMWDNLGRRVSARTPDPEGRFQVAGLPESTWTVRAWCRSADDILWRAEGTVRTGDRIELRLAPEAEDGAR